MRERRERSESIEKKDDPNKWYVDIYNLPEHVNTQDISFFIWKALEKCRGLKKNTTPVYNFTFRLSVASTLKISNAWDCISAAGSKLSTVSISMASSTFLMSDLGRKVILHEKWTKDPRPSFPWLQSPAIQKIEPSSGR